MKTFQDKQEHVKHNYHKKPQKKDKKQKQQKNNSNNYYENSTGLVEINMLFQHVKLKAMDMYTSQLELT